MSVSIVTDNPLFGEILQSTCQSRNVTVQGVFESLDGIGRVQPGETLLIHLRNDDRSLPRMIENLQTRFGTVHTLFLVSDRLSAEMLSALNSPTASIISERDSIDALIGALTLAELGYHVSPLGPAPAPDTQDRDRPRPTEQGEGHDPRLSHREATILEHLLEGLSNKSIAIRLGITETTVKVHLRSVYRKIGVSNRTQAAMWASQELAGTHVGTPSSQGA